jgi:hypothetical protein
LPHRGSQLVDEDEHVNHRRRSTTARQERNEMVTPKKGRYTTAPEQNLRLPLTLVKTNKVRKRPGHKSPRRAWKARTKQRRARKR